MNGFTKEPVRLTKFGELAIGKSDLNRVPMAGVSRPMNGRGPAHEANERTAIANRDLFLAALSAAQALDAAGYDALRVMEAVPGMVRELDRAHRENGRYKLSGDPLAVMEACAAWKAACELVATLRPGTPAPEAEAAGGGTISALTAAGRRKP